MSVRGSASWIPFIRTTSSPLDCGTSEAYDLSALPANTATTFDENVEFDRQVGNLVDLGYPTVTGLRANELVALTEPLRNIDEGIAFITAFPESLEKNNCFQTAGSRRGDRRVPRLWIGDKRPKLGFCWAGNKAHLAGCAVVRRSCWG